MTVSLNADTRRKVAASARLLLSDKPGEVVAALNAMGRLLPNGVSVPDLIEQSLTAGSAPPPMPRRAPSGIHRPLHERARMARYSPHINDWERRFLNDMIDPRGLSQRQESLLKSILRKSEGGVR